MGRRGGDPSLGRIVPPHLSGSPDPGVGRRPCDPSRVGPWWGSTRPSGSGSPAGSTEGYAEWSFRCLDGGGGVAPPGGHWRWGSFPHYGFPGAGLARTGPSADLSYLPGRSAVEFLVDRSGERGIEVLLERWAEEEGVRGGGTADLRAHRKPAGGGLAGLHPLPVRVADGPGPERGVLAGGGGDAGGAGVIRRKRDRLRMDRSGRRIHRMRRRGGPERRGGGGPSPGDGRSIPRSGLTRPGSGTKLRR